MPDLYRAVAIWVLTALGFCAGLGVVSFFLAGAIGFPLTHRYYAPLTLLTFGASNVSWGVESVLSLGHIETCGLLSGNCSRYSVRSIGFLIWTISFAVTFGMWALIRTWRQLRSQNLL